MKLGEKRKWAAERVSTYVLYVLAGLSVLVFGAFFAIGYHRPFDDDPRFNAPLFTNMLLVFMFLLLVTAIAVGIWSVIKSLRRRNKDENVVNGVPVARISYGVAAFTVVLLLLTFLLGSSSSILINAIPYADTFWLKAADMFVWSSGVMLLAGLAAVVFGYTRYYRKEKK